MSEQEQWPYLDAWGQRLDIGDTVKFEGDPATGRLFTIVVFTLDGAKALIYNSPSNKHWVPTKSILWVR